MIDVSKMFLKEDRIRTLEPLHDDDYVPEVRRMRKWGVKGKIIGRHDSHSLCYDVKHDDGSIGTYGPDEILMVRMRWR